jgi:hypothetical protein
MLVAHYYAGRGEDTRPALPVSLDALLSVFREVRL